MNSTEEGIIQVLNIINKFDEKFINNEIVGFVPSISHDKMLKEFNKMIEITVNCKINYILRNYGDDFIVSNEILDYFHYSDFLVSIKEERF